MYPENPKGTRVMIVNHRLIDTSITNYDRYIDTSKSLELDLRQMILSDILSRRDIPSDWHRWINRIKIFNTKYFKLGVRM